jgi:YbbR domain-containing protein
MADAVRRRLTAAVTERLGLKATAMFMAIVLWFVVNAKEPQIELVPVKFSLTLDSSLVLRDQPTQLQAIVAGSPKELIKLSSNPPQIHRQVTADAPDTLQVDLHPSDVILPDGVDAVIRDVQPRSLVLRFEPTWTKHVAIAPSGIDMLTQPGTPMVKPVFDPDVVQVSGPRHLVLQVKSVRTIRTTIPFPDSLPHLVDIDTTGLAPGIRVRPGQVKVQLVPVRG